MDRIVVLLALLVISGPCSAFQITEFCPDPYQPDDADEYIVISGAGLMDGITISDGEGGFRFPPGTFVRGHVTVARNAFAFHEAHGYFPDFEWLGFSLTVPDVIPGDTIRMANTADELMLYEDGDLAQKVAWPSDVKSREGQIHYYESGIWDRRPLFIGQSRFTAATFENITVTAFVSPDSSGDVFSSALDSARQSIHINVYEFASTGLAQSFTGSRNRGTDVLVLVEGGPVGGISPDEKTVLRMMNLSVIPVFHMTAAGDKKSPDRFDHAKYAVIDNRLVLITSENFKASGIPPRGYTGNRGWGVVLEDRGLAEYFETLFRFDIRSKNSIPILGSGWPAQARHTEN